MIKVWVLAIEIGALVDFHRAKSPNLLDIAIAPLGNQKDLEPQQVL